MTRAARRSERWIILGASFSGKSWWAKRQVDRLPRTELVLVWDPTREWAGPDADAGIRGALVFPGMAELAVWARDHNPVREGKRLVVQSGRTRPRDFPLFCRFAYALGSCWCVIDEAHAWARADSIPRELVYLSQVSRHRRVNLVTIAQRPTGLAPDIRDNKGRTILFRMPGEASLAWVRNEFGKTAEESVRKLPPRCYVEPEAESSKPPARGRSR